MILSSLFTEPLNPAFPSGNLAPVFNIRDSITDIFGKHIVKGGFTLSRTRRQSFNYAGMYPNISLATVSGNTPPATIGPSGSAISSNERLVFNSLPYYIRSYPPFTNLLVGSNEGRSYYNSLQTSARITLSRLTALVGWTGLRPSILTTKARFTTLSTYSLRVGQAIRAFPTR